MDNKELANLLLPGLDKTPEYYEDLYKDRKLPEGAMVVRFAPSPTGVVHMGSLYASFVNTMYARQSQGVVYLRIEDTDGERSIENGVELIIRDLKNCEITFDEGPTIGGEYGPYIQSERRDIYQTFAKMLIEKGLAYPCFCSKEDMTNMRAEQDATKNRTGYYGMYAKCRNLSNEDIEERVARGDKFVIRLRSKGSFRNKIVVKDEIRGKVSFPENDMDVVIIKDDGLPTYHFAHICDDHLMKTTHVIRGDEWLPSLPLHIQMFETMGWEPPKYVHIAPIGKIDEEDPSKKRKLSKRKDPEAAVSYYHEHGIPTEVLKLYLATIANTNFEEWYMKNSDLPISEFKFDFKKMSISVALFDLEKLNNIARIYFSRLKAEDLYDKALIYNQEFDCEFASLMEKHKDYMINILNIERNIKKPRKDIATYADVKEVNWYMFDELYNQVEDKELFKDLETDKKYDTDILDKYIDEYFNENDSKEEWFEKLKSLADNNGYASDTKAYKENPDNYKGHVGDICEYIRVAVTSKTKTPDLYEILKLLGKNRIKTRIDRFKNAVK